jgi:hypothetical protein
MNAFFEDLCKKTVEAKERGVPTVEVARTFDMMDEAARRMDGYSF